MKKHILKLFTAVFLVMVFCMGSVSCSSDDDDNSLYDPDKPLVGQWKLDEGDGYYYIVTITSNKFTEDYYENNKQTWSLSGTYTTSGNRITIKLSNGDFLAYDFKLYGENKLMLDYNAEDEPYYSDDDFYYRISEVKPSSDSGTSDGKAKTKTYTVKGVSFKMIGVEGGTFQMGSNYETPVHSVTLSSYYIGQTEVTWALWRAVMGIKIPVEYYNLPMEYVSWNDCQNFITKLNQLTGKTFRLPTEAEWEFAAKGGNKSQGYKYSGSNTVGEVAWYYSNSWYYDNSHQIREKSHPVATKSPNEMGIYDMSGNVSEWCQDWYGSYSNSAQTNPTGPGSGSYRVLRGGCYYDDVGKDNYLSSTDRNRGWPDNGYSGCGLRLALSE